MRQNSGRIIKHELDLLSLTEKLGGMSKTYQVMGLSCDSFYRYKSAHADSGLEALLEKHRCYPNLANRVDERTESAVDRYAIGFPARG